MLLKQKISIPLINKTISYKFVTGQRGSSFNIILLPTPTERTNGFTSYTSDGKHILMTDYDNVELEEIIKEWYFLQQLYKLSDVYVFENDRENSYFAFCLDKFNLHEAIDIIVQTQADRGFKKAPLWYGMKRWVIRWDKKGEREPPKFLLRLKGKEVRERSNAHRILLNNVFGTKIRKTNYFDSWVEIDLYSYLTGSKVKKTT